MALKLFEFLGQFIIKPDVIMDYLNLVDTNEHSQQTLVKDSMNTKKNRKKTGLFIFLKKSSNINFRTSKKKKQMPLKLFEFLEQL